MKLRRISAVLLSIVLAFSCLVLPLSATAWDGTASSAPSGEGTEASPYLISTPAELAWLALQNGEALSAYYKVTADIDLGGKEWNPIGPKVESEWKAFTGTFDGQYHTIKNFKVTGKERCGLFASLGANSVVKNITLTDITVVTVETSTGFGAALAGYADTATITGIVVGENVSVTGYNVGGVVGRTWNKLSNISYCTNAATVATDGKVAGEAVGGIVGLACAVNISYCSNSGTISTVANSEQLAGGIAGRFGGSVLGSIDHCINTGSVSSTHTAGGIAGKNMFNDCTYDSCVSTVAPAAGNADWSGVLVGRFSTNQGSLTNSFCVANDTYGIIGKNSTNAPKCTMTNTVALGETDDKTAMETLKSAIEKAITDKISAPEPEPEPVVDPANPAELGTPTGIVGNVWDGSIATAFESGTGTATDPFVIKTAAQFAFFAKYVNETIDRQAQPYLYFVLGANIDLNGRDWTPIGNKQNPFFGSFNGKGFTVFNFYVRNTDANNGIAAGLFGALNNATVKNVTVDWARIDVIGKNSIAGAIAGTAQNASILACTVGENVAVKLTDTGIGNTTYAGGIVGTTSNSKVEIKNCINSATVYAANTVSTVGAGGIVGLAGPHAEISFCVNNGAVKTGTLTTINNIAGGIIGNMGASSQPASVSDCTNHGDIESRHTAGGIVGRLNVRGNTVTNCYSTGKVTGNLDYSGLAIGRPETNATLSNCGYLAQNPAEKPNDANVWEVKTAMGAKNAGLVDAISNNTCNEMTEAVLQPLMDAQLLAVQNAIAASIIAAEPEPQPDVDPTPDTDPTPDADPTPTPDDKTGDNTDNKTETPATEEKGCASSSMSLGVLFTVAILGGAVLSFRKKEEQ